jgi:hypothetical protein
MMTLWVLLTITKGEALIEMKKITAKGLQSTLKVAISTISNQDFNLRLGTAEYDKDNNSKSRNQCKNVKLRHIYTRGSWRTLSL